MAAILQSGGAGGGDGVGDELRTALRMRNINNVLYEYFHTFDLGCDLLDMVLFISTLRLLIRNELYMYIYICIKLCPRVINGKHTRVHNKSENTGCWETNLSYPKLHRPHIPQYTIRMCIFLFWILCCGICERCIFGSEWDWLIS